MEQLIKKLGYLASTTLQEKYIVHGTQKSYILPEELIEDAFDMVRAVKENRSYVAALSSDHQKAVIEFGKVLEDNVKGIDIDLKNSSKFELINKNSSWIAIREAAQSCLYKTGFNMNQFEAEELKKAIDYPCPVCGFLVFDEPPGSYNICSVCGWEDDDVQLRYPAMRGGANKNSLWEEQQILIKKIPITVKQHSKFTRDLDWRPLMPNECEEKNDQPKTGLQYFNKTGEVTPHYYWLK